MSTARVEAFSDGVIAIIVTIMVLELKVPDDSSARALVKVLPLFLVYALSFLTVAIMWVNHHHFLKAARRPEAALLWSNNNLLFWMSMIPFATRYLGQNSSSYLPVGLYAALLALTSASFYWLIVVVGLQNRDHPALFEEFGHQRTKALITAAVYLACAGLACLLPRLALAIVVVLPAIYFLPERRLVGDRDEPDGN
jgi:uncharacterized membrane protein